MSYPNPIFSAISFCCFLLCVVTSPWRIQAWNVGVCSYALWSGLTCLNGSINSIVWHGNLNNVAPIWCDISSKFIIGGSVGIPCASLCIIRRLYCISTSSVTASGISGGRRRREIAIDLFISVGLPFLEMILHYIPQGHRFNIFEDIGCWPSTFNSWPAYVLVFCPPVVISCTSVIYAILSGLHVNKHRKAFNEVLASHSNLDSSMYFRLLSIAIAQILFALPMSLIAVIWNIKTGIHPWISWTNAHFQFSRVDTFMGSEWRANLVAKVSLEFSRWAPVFSAMLFLAFFGFSRAAMDNYHLVVRGIGKIFHFISGGRLSFIDLSNPGRKNNDLEGIRFASSPHLQQTTFTSTMTFATYTHDC